MLISDVCRCLPKAVFVAKIVLNKASILPEEGNGFVCLLIFQPGIISRSFFYRFFEKFIQASESGFCDFATLRMTEMGAIVILVRLIKGWIKVKLEQGFNDRRGQSVMSDMDRILPSYLVRAPGAGYTLVELVVVVALCVLVLTVAIYLFAQSGLTSRRLAKTQNLQDVTNRLLSDLRRDVRSATEATFSSKGMRLLVTKLSQEGMPEQVEVLYRFSGEGVTREEDSRSKRFTFRTLIEADDHWSITTLHKRRSDAGVFVHIDALDHSGDELLHVVENLITVDPASYSQ